jgi:hypothetical protein
MSGPSVTKKTKPVCDEMKINDKCTFSEGWLHSKKKNHLNEIRAV